MKHIMTIDLEDWFHCFEPDQANWNTYEDRIVSVTHEILNIFKENNTTATFFVLADIAKRHPNLISTIKNHGHEIGCHGSSHKLVYTQSQNEFKSDVLMAKQQIEEITKIDVVSYRAPFFSITKKSLWALEILKDIGIKYDSSIFPVYNHRYGIPNAKRFPHLVIDKLFELPLTTYRILGMNIPISGGAYFRIFPFWFTRLLFKLHSANKEPIIFYLHPWELDVKQPKIQKYSPQGIRHYWNLDKTLRRLTKITQEYNFVSIQEFYES